MNIFKTIIGKIAENKNYQRILIIFATVVLTVIIVANGGDSEKYNLELKQYSTQDIFAPRDVIDRYTKQMLESQAENSVELKYVQDQDTTNKIQSNLDVFLNKLKEVRTSSLSLNEKVNQIKKNGIVKISDESIQSAVKADAADYNIFEKLTKDILRQTLTSGVKEDSLIKTQEEIKQSYQKAELSQDLRSLGYDVVTYVVKPNMFIDIDGTKLVREQAKSKVRVEDYTYKKGRKIISKGEEVTQQHIALLKELGMLKGETSSKDYLNTLVGAALVIILSLLLAHYIYYFNKKVYIKVRELSLLCVVTLVSLIISTSVYKALTFVVPITFAAMLIAIFLETRLAVIVNFVLTLLIALALKSDSVFIMSSVITGTFAGYLVSNVSTRGKLAFNGLILSFINVLTVVCIEVLGSYDSFTLMDDAKIAFLNIFFSTIFVIGTLPLWESIFNIVTPFKLLELSNPNHPVLKRLLVEAPGTYHHSLMVGNLAESAAEAIGANGLLARVSAYYHDIGKLRNPYFYKENQFNENPHTKIKPAISASLIISHTKDGIDLANQYKIPPQIKDIIEQHHGTTLVAYFYHAAKKENKNAEIKEEDFRYKGPKPQTKESAVVMLADSVEASVRSINEPSEEKIGMMIKKIVKDKLDDEQLSHCNITFKDVDTISKAFMSVLSGLFHSRIEYPEISIPKQPLESIDPLEQKILKL